VIWQSTASCQLKQHTSYLSRGCIAALHIILSLRYACNQFTSLQMIDEVHTLIGAGAAEGAIDAANILKPALARGELQCIGATTLDEYRKHIEKDPALER
jgi:hypothetical protein